MPNCALLSQAISGRGEGGASFSSRSGRLARPGRRNLARGDPSSPSSRYLIQCILAVNLGAIHFPIFVESTYYVAVKGREGGPSVLFPFDSLP